MKHIVLCGDSIFDNASYVDGGPDVAAQLRACLDPEDKVTLLAVDGSISRQVETQLVDLPSDATHLIVSTGGNDVLHNAALLEQKTATIASAMAVLMAANGAFAPEHAGAVQLARQLDLPVAFCTIYDANMGPLITTALSIFNDAITRNVHAAGVDLIDLRLICPEIGDYANPIEPSVQGGEKIAAAISRYAKAVRQQGAGTRVFV
ncbi:GDSL-type esterase/lipase family protein [Erythrobacter sp. Alg231-14]|uniref:GDSL-type esterase/lipase family protein n=1 Tax=Erythrobacter sp. Alg231-14 TaxID=1922225 RepID=UPI000D556A5C